MVRTMMLLAAGAGALLSTAAGAATPITYTGTQQVGTVTAAYTITTDGTLSATPGAPITASHITAYSVTFTDPTVLVGGVADTLTFGRTAMGGTGSYSGDFAATATALTSPFIDSLQLYSNDFSGGSDLAILDFRDFLSGTYLQWNDAAHNRNYIVTNTQNNYTTPYATAVPAAAPVPEPASWATMLLGMGVLGAALRRRAATRVRFA